MIEPSAMGFRGGSKVVLEFAAHCQHSLGKSETDGKTSHLSYVLPAPLRLPHTLTDQRSSSLIC